MSVQAMTAVWTHSRHKGSKLILLLAIADYANEQAVAWPSIQSLADKARMSERNVHYALKELTEEDDPELTVLAGAGPHRCNLYQINLEGAKFAGCKPAHKRVQNSAPRVQPVAPNPSLESVKNPSIESASDANAPTPPPPDTPRPSRSRSSRKVASAPAQEEAGPPPSPPVTPEQAAANDAAFAALEAAPPEARQPTRASGTSKDALERAIGDVCFRADRDLRRANMGVIRKVGADIRAMNADLETPITAELIYLVFEDSGYWQRHYMSLDETTSTRRLPTPGIVGKHTLNILAWGKGQTQAPPPPLVRYTAPPSPEPIFRRRTPAELEALRRQALEGLPEANYARTA